MNTLTQLTKCSNGYIPNQLITYQLCLQWECDNVIFFWNSLNWCMFIELFVDLAQGYLLLSKRLMSHWKYHFADLLIFIDFGLIIICDCGYCHFCLRIFSFGHTVYHIHPFSCIHMSTPWKVIIYFPSYHTLWLYMIWQHSY